MLKFIAIAVVATGLVFGASVSAQAATHGGCTSQSSPVQVHAAPGPVTAQARSNGYRSYSYEPGTTSSYRSRNYRSFNTQRSNRDAGAKARGEF